MHARDFIIASFQPPQGLCSAACTPQSLGRVMYTCTYTYIRTHCHLPQFMRNLVLFRVQVLVHNQSSVNVFDSSSAPLSGRVLVNPVLAYITGQHLRGDLVSLNSSVLSCFDQGALTEGLKMLWEFCKPDLTSPLLAFPFISADLLKLFLVTLTLPLISLTWLKSYCEANFPRS